MTPDEQIAALHELKKSRAWGLVMEQLHFDYSYRVTVLARDRKMSREDVEYNRGIIFAIESLIKFPESKIKSLQDRKIIEQSKTKKEPKNV